MNNRPQPANTEAAAVSYTSLSRVMNRLQAVLMPAIDKEFWLRAELGSANERDGAFYGELVETSKSGAPIAKLRCTIWSSDLRRIRARFAAAGLELELRQGTVVGVQCAVQFHAVHGLSVRVIDMDPSFVLGELELRRQRILASLERDGLMDRNATRPVPLLPNRILLITSRAGAAFQDFTRTLESRRRFGFRIYLADTIVQGPRTEDSVLAGLALADRLTVDLVVLVRGGGSKLDLGALDSELIARRIAGLNLPVWTGIGHEIDTSVLDAVAARSFRTPTAVAEELTGRFERVCTRTDEAQMRLRKVFDTACRLQRERIARSSTGLRQGSRKMVAQRRAELAAGANQLRGGVTQRMAFARAVTVARTHRLQRTAHSRLSLQRQILQHVHASFPTATRRALERNARQLRETRNRFERLRLAERFHAERARTSALYEALVRGSTRKLLAGHAALDTGAVALRIRVAARLSSARLQLAPRTQHMRSLLDLRTRTASARLEALLERFTSASSRALQRYRGALQQAREQFSPERALGRCERERAALTVRSHMLRASDPRRALERGFSLTYTSTGELLRSVRGLTPGQAIETQLADGRIAANIRDTRHTNED
jgi:exodeoxyribonuclease VII large subunit